MKVVLFSVDGLHCHWLGPYGNEWVATPNLDRLATESIVFDRHFAPANDPASLRQSLLPLFDSNRTTIHLNDCRQSNPLAVSKTIRTRPGDFVTPADALWAALDDALREPFDFLWIESDRLIPPWDFEFETYQQYADTSGGFVEDRDPEAEPPIDDPQAGPLAPNDLALWHRLHNSFAAAVNALDHEWGGIAQRLTAAKLHETAIWIFTSPLGWPLGEHGIVGRGGSRLHAELIHVPLIVRMPNATPPMARRSDFTLTTDLADLIQAGEIPVGREQLLLKNSVRNPEWTYLSVENDEPARLYHKPDDVWEANDLAARDPDECDRFDEMLRGCHGV